MAEKHDLLAHHFEDLGQQHEAATLGMWIFLATELMVFGGLFAGYASYRWEYPDAFARGSSELNVWYAGVNTIVLLTSSLTMALAVHAAQVGQRKPLTVFLTLTALLGAAFLVIKGFEYHEDYEKGLVPGLNINESLFPRPSRLAEGIGPPEAIRREGDVSRPETTPRDRHAPSPTQAHSFPRQVMLFLMFYYIMTGLHALHLIIGITFVSIQAAMAWRGAFPPERYFPVEVGGLYWHFVDVVWIFLLPLLYLIGGVGQ